MKTTDAAITLAKCFQGRVVDSLPPAKPAMPLKISHCMSVSNAAVKRSAIERRNFQYSVLTVIVIGTSQKRMELR